MKNIEKIIEEEYKKLKLEQATDGSRLEEMLRTAIDQMDEHAMLMKELTYYLVSEKDKQELAKKLVESHGRYTRTMKEILDSL